MHCSVIIALIHYACNYSASTLRTGGSIRIGRYFNSTLSILLLFRISKPKLVQGLSKRLTNHTCKNGGYRYFMPLYPVVISNSISVSEYWHKYPTLKLSSISCSSTLILVHIIKNNFNSASCPGFLVFYLGLTANVCVQEM